MAVNLEKIKEPALKNKKSDLNKDRRFTVLLEALRSEFRIFGESLLALREKVNSIFEMTGKNTEDISDIKTDIHVIKSDIKTFNKRISLIEEHLPAS